MLFSLYCLDYPDGYPLRMANYDAHRTYLANSPVKVVMSGPLESDDGEKRIGSLLIIEAENLDQATAFSNADPFRMNGVFESVEIRRFVKAIDNR
ncbi:YciI family protein [Polynucleobacter sp. MWH-HuK1]|uniref:YciI family protein n=1 Tax=Polynucleobacter sp. MWH-HuK1 TaxID=1743158 RepID=UPI001C0C763B|nr:YciI family protein [Polynucleobacter sp. MWH-HuK1]MBU3565885.1 YciI family protein [Polynucleobacter sp. MWH-HuK1]